MSNVVKHERGQSGKSNKNILVTIFSILAVIVLLFGLNYFISKNNKNNSELVGKVVGTETTKGDLNAAVRIVEYSDFQCPACAGFASVFSEVFNNINEKYGPSALSVTYKHFPLTSIHPNALLAGYSAEAAKLQGKFWEMHDKLFENQNEWGNAMDAGSKIEGYAKDLGLDMAKFIQDRDSKEVQKIVNDSLIEAKKLGLSHTPFVFMDGVEMENLQLSVEYIQEVIENRLQELGVSPLNN